MKIRYQREIRRNYLIIEMESDLENYEMRMAEENSIPGFLPFQIRETGKRKECCYEITSRQPLSRMVERREMRGEELRHLILCIAAAAEGMGKYLLSEEHILLEPDFIYVEPQNYAVSLCFVPEYSGSFPEAVSRLMEYLLGRISHEDREGVVLAYELLQVTKRENYGIRDLLRTLYQPAGLRGDGGARRREEERKKLYLEKKSGEWRQPEEEAPVFPEEKEKKGFLGRLKRRRKEEEGSWHMSFPDEEDEWEADQKLHSPVQAGKYPYENWTTARSHGEEQAVAESWVRYEAPSYAEEEGAVLPDQRGEGERRLTDLTGGREIWIPYFPFLIGKQEGLVDCVLSRDTVSRLHARIDRDEEGYTVTDLNSTNGVRVGGRLLQTNETAPLPVGSEIYFADAGFLFL